MGKLRKTQTYCRPALAGTVVLWLSGCTVGPNYVRPSAEAPAAYKETPRTSKKHSQATRSPRANGGKFTTTRSSTI